MRRKIFMILVLLMLFSMPTWQFYMHNDRTGKNGGSSPSSWSETYSVGFPAAYMYISHTRTVGEPGPGDGSPGEALDPGIVSIDRYSPAGFINLLLFAAAMGGLVLIDKKRVRLPPVVNSGFVWSRLYIVAVFLFGIDTISVTVALFKLDPANSFLKTWLNVVYNGAELGRALVFPLPTVTSKYFDIMSDLHMKIVLSAGIVLWFILGMAIYKLFHLVKQKLPGKRARS